MDSQLWVWQLRTHEILPLEEMREKLNAIAKKWVFQKEKCPTTGREHYQIMLSLRDKRKKKGMIELCPWAQYIGPVVDANKGDWSYVQKADTRIEGPWKFDDIVLKMTKEVRECKSLKPWQESLLTISAISNTRNVNVVIDKVGGIGKTFITKYMDQKGLACALPATLSTAEKLIAFAYGCPETKAYIIDMPRALKKADLGGFYSAVEDIKNGFMYDPRYTTKKRWQEPPAVWVFTNVQPALKYLSSDRWVFWTVIGDQLVKGSIEGA